MPIVPRSVTVLPMDPLDSEHPDDAAQSPRVVLEHVDPGITIVRLNRPDKRNALDIPMRQAISAAFVELAADPRIRCVVLTGGDSVFAAGADLNMLVDRDAEQTAALDLPQYWRPVASFPKPVIAAVNGVAFGAGCELTMMCDIIVAGQSAKFGQPEAAVGIMPGAGGVQRLGRLIGSKAASLMLFTAEPLDAARAFELGLVSALVEPEAVMTRALDLAKRIARMPPRALVAIKRNLQGGADLPLDAALRLEQREFLQLFDTADKTEGMKAFLDRRKPNFTGS
ncbi:enoyl-CoA hydratase-related protein [Brevundimonas denitrificans]|uniref:Enoyl-CoA hydratase n=2 Tax=Brevundimonas TaxID=41275 RepID=A0A8E0KMQ0_9CAUL|nr:enoyl-CoA hydratase-related protein [Brevundimonas denitrificans]GAD58627.1 enoyl-CoA hydratase [Brevundimonas abyssalis TAR-001]